MYLSVVSRDALTSDTNDVVVMMCGACGVSYGILEQEIPSQRVGRLSLCHLQGY